MDSWGLRRGPTDDLRPRKKGGMKKMPKKKKPVFGQLTLTGDLALDWMKDGMEIEVAVIEIGPIGAFQRYNVPDWATERSGDIALLHKPDQYSNPVLVTQRSILRALEIFCVNAEENGAVTSIEKVNEFLFGRLELNDEPVKLKFTRDASKGKFAPYEMEEL
jgi:hypothetical protein